MTPTTPVSMTSAQDHLVELFGKLCGDPDDTVVAVEADRALHRLDELLAAGELDR
jgi:hypothetical protein